MTSVVVVGATGHFGGRICRRLVRKPGMRLLVSSRSLAAASAFCETLTPAYPDTSVEPAELDHRSASFSSALGKLNADIVVHTAGPYQGQDYSVAKACLQNGCHYVDLADGRDFVREFSRLTDEAVDKNLLLVSGASTLPGLSSVVVAALAPQFEEIRSIRTTIAPAHQTPRGRGTILAVMSYCGKPFSVLEDGEWRTRFGWQDLRRARYPGQATRLAAACDVPDLDLFPKLYPRLETATFHAALEAPWEQLALWAMAGMTRFGVVRNWTRCAAAFESISRSLSRLGSDRGGMTVEVSGRGRNGVERSILWHLAAGRNHGPEIPCTPAIVLVSKLIEGEIPVRGAMPCIALFSLDDFRSELEGFDISWAHRCA